MNISSMNNYTTGSRLFFIARWQEKLEQLILLCFSVFPLTTLFQSMSIFRAINQLLIVVLVFLLLAYALITRIDKGVWLALLIMAANSLIDFAVTKSPYVSVNMIVYLPVWCLMFTYFAYMKEKIGKRFEQVQTPIFVICVIWSLVVAVSAAFPSSYYVEDTWGSTRYFASITGNVFRLEPSAATALILLAVLARLGKYDRKALALMSLVPLYCAFFGGSRTYLVVIAVLYVVFLRQLIQDKGKFRAILGVGVALFVVAVLSTSIGDKILNGLNTSAWYVTDPLAQLTSGRSEFWAIDMREYFAMPLHQQLFGSGFNEIFEINLREYGRDLWGHNDFVNLLITNGLTGVILYLYFAFRCVLAYAGDWRGAKWILVTLVIFAWLFNAFFNMAYTYMCSAIAFAIALTTCSMGSRPTTMRQPKMLEDR